MYTHQFDIFGIHSMEFISNVVRSKSKRHFNVVDDTEYIKSRYNHLMKYVKRERSERKEDVRLSMEESAKGTASE